MTELDELEEIANATHNSSMATRKQRRAGRNFLDAGLARTSTRPKWQRQLSAERAWPRKPKAKVTA